MYIYFYAKSNNEGYKRKTQRNSQALSCIITSSRGRGRVKGKTTWQSQVKKSMIKEKNNNNKNNPMVVRIT